MATLQRKLPNYIKLIDEVDTIIIDHKRLENGSRESSGIFTIREEIVGDTQRARLTLEYKDNSQDRNFIINDDKGIMIVKTSYTKRKCSGNTLHIYSPAGFLVGSVMERRFKCKSNKEIVDANYGVVFLLTQNPKGSDEVIEIYQNNGKDVVATVSSSLMQNGTVIHSIIYSKEIHHKIPALQKILILCGVISTCQQRQTSLKSKFNCYCKCRVCCRLYYDRKILFCILCFIFPLVFAVYFILIFFFISYLVGSLFLPLFCFYKYGDTEPVFSCIFKWPCRLCNNDNCTGNKPLKHQCCCILHISAALFCGIPVFAFSMTILVAYLILVVFK